MVSSLTAVVCITIFCLTQRNVHAQGGFWISGLRAVPSKLDKTVNKRVLKTDCTALLTTAGLRQDYDSCLQNKTDVCSGICQMIDSAICCDSVKSQQLICNQTFSRGLVCDPVRRKLTEGVKKFMNCRGFTNSDVRCCVDVVGCCGKSEHCSVSIACENIKSDVKADEDSDALGFIMTALVEDLLDNAKFN